MPYKLRKAPKKELYWVTEIGTSKKFSKLPIPLNKAKAQMRVLESALKGGVRVPRGMHNPSDEGEYDLEDEVERSINPPARELQPKAVRHPRPEDEPEGPEGPAPAKMARTSGRAGRGKKGGMIRNPLLVLTAEKDAKQIIQMELEQSDGAIGFANGKYSMEEILNRTIQNLIRSNKQEAVSYVQKIIEEYSSNPEYKVQTPAARQKLAKAMGFTVGGKKPRGSGHTDELKAAYRERLSNASPQQRVVLTEIFNTALATIKALPPSRPLLKRITGQPADAVRDERKRFYLRNAIFDMDQAMGLGPNLDLDDEPELVEPILPNPNPAPAGVDFNTECPICMQEVTDNKHRTPCGHVFHQQCFNKWKPIDPVTGLRRCPVCRKGAGKKSNSGKGKDDDDKYALFQKIEKQLADLINKQQNEKDYDQIDALITNLKSEAESFLARPGAKEEHKMYIRFVLHTAIPGLLTRLAKIPKQASGKYKKCPKCKKFKV
jgi:hypothetical protein